MARSQIIKNEDDSYDAKSNRNNQKYEQPIQSPPDDYANDQKKVGRWTPQEDDKLQKLIEEYGEKSWRLISNVMEGRSAIQCLHRWTKILRPGLKKGPWQNNEDERLLEWVKNNGPNKWSLCAENITGRSGKQCRERWFNNLNPNVKKGGWTSDEDNEIFKGYLAYSSSWSKIAKNLSGRTENSVKNRFYSTVRKLLADQEKNGISLQMLEVKQENGTSALQTFVKAHLQKFEQYLSIQMEEEKPAQDLKLEEMAIKSEDDSVSKRKMYTDTYQEQNLLYRLLQSQGGPIKRTSCMKDYSTIYKKYKKRYNQRKKDKQQSEKVDRLRKIIMKKDIQKSFAEQQELNLKQNLEQYLLNFQECKLEQQNQYQDSDKLDEFQDKLLRFFNSQLDQIMTKVETEMDNTKQQKLIQDEQQLQQQITKQLRTQNSKRQITKLFEVKEEEVQFNQQVINTFLKRFIQFENNDDKTDIANFIIQNHKIDSKMMFLISQLHTLETMLGDTKKEFSRLESSLYDKIHGTSFQSSHSNQNI
ncbi:unnamed protein product [Paramecium octaurelia]|uniref:Uncharacterized protein n=1 Tax=Paramecium octaurelia TaxID=43137 RepID=A0A8S1Y3X4_PAROT|nr:unnamed protein product [Paramecium octaurelia]